MSFHDALKYKFGKHSKNKKSRSVAHAPSTIYRQSASHVCIKQNQSINMHSEARGQMLSLQ